MKAIDTRCPQCSARPGQQCRMHDARVLPFHKARVEASRRGNAAAEHRSPKITTRYLEGEIVDGNGLPLYEHASTIAGRLNLDEHQVTELVSELRNALTPAEYWAARGDKRAAKGIRRVLELATAIAEGRRGR